MVNTRLHVLSALVALNMVCFVLFIIRTILSFWLQYEVGLVHETIINMEEFKVQDLSELLKW